MSYFLKKHPPLILASSSPYRQALLTKLHLNFSAVAPDIDEQFLAMEAPEMAALRISKLKAEALREQFPAHLIIGSDQVAMLGGTQLRKPGNRAETINQLKACSGNSVLFYTAICVLDSQSGQKEQAIDLCQVFFKPLNEKSIINYVELEKPFDCAGGFKSEGLGIALIEKIKGDDPNALIGLPLIKLIGLLEKFYVSVI
ncbi:Maf family nucleotide pyrophosphatase [Methylicorpusculum oleiharenae]|uniref:Maf family protein n=1 Tax=Methylicorpusculum oleiharenae TaxID=1338687 RepID=UPI00135B209F|nr:Maf family nucleotide pyrophosphatase [Methylicorpusculum oleiharenae]MCD2453137.1 Maf family nucleotide pyrophosphatase [Methylicorpusculum oleiharenae]